MRLVFLGTADAFHGGGRAHTSLLVEDSRGKLLLDCGPTAPLALAKLGIPLSAIGELAITHLHGDHFAGTAALLLDGIAHGRPGPLVVAGPELTSSRVEALLRTLYPASAERVRGFFLDYRELAPGEAIDLGGRRLLAYRAAHPVPGSGALSYRLETDGRVIAFTGDTGPGADLASLAENADVLVCECSLAQGSSDRHLSVEDVRRLRPTWRAKKVVLAHLSAESRSAAATIPDVVVADDGLALPL